MKRILFAFSLMAATTASFAQVAKPMEDVNKVIDNTVDSLNKAMTARIQPGTSRKGNNPVLFLIGNSTMRNGTLGNGNNGQWGIFVGFSIGSNTAGRTVDGQGAIEIVPWLHRLRNFSFSRSIHPGFFLISDDPIGIGRGTFPVCIIGQLHLMGDDLSIPFYVEAYVFAIRTQQSPAEEDSWFWAGKATKPRSSFSICDTGVCPCAWR